MTLIDWLHSGWLVQHKTTPDEVAGFLALADRDLRDAETESLSEDWQFNIAYNAALQLATLALAASGYQAARGGSHHHRTIQSLAHTLVLDVETVQLVDRFRKKRNVAEYDSIGMISQHEAREMLALAKQLRVQVFDWLAQQHPELT